MKIMLKRNWAWALSVTVVAALAVTVTATAGTTAPGAQVQGNVSSTSAKTESVAAAAESSKEKKSPWSAEIAASYNGGFRDDVDPYNFYELTLGYKISESSSLSAVQGINHLSYVYPGQSELQAADTSIALSRKLSKDFFGYKLGGKFKLTVPTSETSQRVDVLTKPSLSFTLSDKFFKEKLGLSLTGSGTYYVNRYKTTPTIEGAGGGRPLRHWLAGISLAANYKLNDKVSFDGSGGYSYVAFEQVDFKNDFSQLGLSNPPVHRYAFSLGANYAWNDHLSLSLGYSQDSQVEKMGGLEMVLFDDMVTEWSVGASYSF
ncbi:MAG: TonB-dependent receptor [Bdellovibrionales bacterium]|nr:TonB-dependent receptor [Bdellovibrionales bacterium]